MILWSRQSESEESILKLQWQRSFAVFVVNFLLLFPKLPVQEQLFCECFVVAVVHGTRIYLTLQYYPFLFGSKFSNPLFFVYSI
jgi:hypothetical protein